MVSPLQRITQPTLDVLNVLLHHEHDETYGWRIAIKARQNRVTVYKILQRLAAAGWVTDQWDPNPDNPNRPRKRYYRLTPAGAAKAHELLQQKANPR